MAISSLIGLPRHGKSYSAIELFILVAAKKGRTIITNIPLQSAFYEAFPDVKVIEIDLEKYATASEQEWDELPAGIYVLDELWKIWPYGLQAKDIPIHQVRFIKEHGHKLDENGKETDIILVTQVLDDIASVVRKMVETTIVCTKLTDLGLMNKFRRDYYRGVIKEFNAPKSKFIKTQQCSYNKEIYQYYKSHTLSEDTEDVDGKGVVNATIFNSFSFKASVVVVILLIIGIVFGYNSVKEDVKKLTTPKEIKPINRTKYDPRSIPLNAKDIRTQNTLHQVIEPKAKKEEQTLEESVKFRLIGLFVEKNDEHYALITDGKYTRKINPKNCHFDYQTICLYKNEIVTHYTGIEGYEEIGKGSPQDRVGKQINSGLGKTTNRGV